MRRLTSYLLRGGLFVLAVAIAFGGWAYWRKSSDTPAEQRYLLEDITYGDLTQTVSANGTLNPVVLVNVGTQVSGTIRSLSDVESSVNSIVDHMKRGGR